MPLSQFVKQNVITVRPEENLRAVATLMRNEDVGAILVCSPDGKPIGIVTDRDIVLRCVVEGGDCEEATARDVMSIHVATCSLDQGIKDVIQTMQDSSVRRVPIVDEEGRAVALLSFGDIFAMLATEMDALSEVATPEMQKLRKAA